MTKHQCECGTVYGVSGCGWSGELKHTVVVEVMPEFLRTQHRAAGNFGVYPENGAIRIQCGRECADTLVAGDEDGYDHVVQ